MEGCGKVEGKGGSPEASGDAGGVCASPPRKGLARCYGNNRQQVKAAARIFVFCKTIFFFLAFQHIVNETEKVHTTKGVKNL